MITKDNYELVYEKLLRELAKVDLSKVVEALGGVYHGDHLEMKCLGESYHLTHHGIRKADGKSPNVATKIVLSHYLLQAGQGRLTGEWVSYRDFKDSAFFMTNFQVNAEDRIAAHFAGRASKLEDAALSLYGEPYKEFQTGDVCYYIQALPKVPVLLVFYDKDADFRASCKLLFDRSAPTWLDMECLAVLGWLVAERLIKSSRQPTQTNKDESHHEGR